MQKAFSTPNARRYGAQLAVPLLPIQDVGGDQLDFSEKRVVAWLLLAHLAHAVPTAARPDPVALAPHRAPPHNPAKGHPTTPCHPWLITR